MFPLPLILSFPSRSPPSPCSDVAWTQPGAAADCDTTWTWTVPVPPGHTMSGMMAVALQLPAALIQSWTANSGAANYGLLLRWAVTPRVRTAGALRAACWGLRLRGVSEQQRARPGGTWRQRLAGGWSTNPKL
jgi:hypothetical protein